MLKTLHTGSFAQIGDQFGGRRFEFRAVPLIFMLNGGLSATFRVVNYIFFSLTNCRTVRNWFLPGQYFVSSVESLSLHGLNSTRNLLNPSLSMALCVPVLSLRTWRSEIVLGSKTFWRFTRSKGLKS